MTNDHLVLGLMDRVAFEAAQVARRGDNQAHGALHVVETKLRELRVCCLEAEKVVKGDDQIMLLLRIRAPLANPGTPETAALLDELIPTAEAHS